jgi:hypothetical protein
MHFFICYCSLIVEKCTRRPMLVIRHCRSRSRLRCLVVLLAAWGLLGSQISRAQDAKPTEYQVKAAYLSNFGRFVEWPAGNASDSDISFNICVLGRDPFGPALDAAFAGETVDHAKLEAKRITAPRDAANCRIVFISSSEDSQLKDILSTLDRMSILTVSDLPQFTKRGGMIQFVLNGNRVRFEINLATARHAGLNLSSELLKLATIVRGSS